MSIDAGVMCIAPYSGAESGCHDVPLPSRSIGIARSVTPFIVIPVIPGSMFMPGMRGVELVAGAGLGAVVMRGVGAMVMPGIGAIVGDGVGLAVPRGAAVPAGVAPGSG